MLYAPARLTVTVLGTLVEEASFAREAIEFWNVGDGLEEEKIRKVQLEKVGSEFVIGALDVGCLRRVRLRRVAGTDGIGGND